MPGLFRLIFLLKTVTWGLTLMENLDEIIKEIREKGYNQELVDNYITDKRFMRELLDRDKEYD